MVPGPVGPSQWRTSLHPEESERHLPSGRVDRRRRRGVAVTNFNTLLTSKNGETNERGSGNTERGSGDTDTNRSERGHGRRNNLSRRMALISLCESDGDRNTSRDAAAITVTAGTGGSSSGSLW